MGEKPRMMKRWAKMVYIVDGKLFLLDNEIMNPLEIRKREPKLGGDAGNLICTSEVWDAKRPIVPLDGGNSMNAKAAIHRTPPFVGTTYYGKG
jgi:hypothetical protein